jgi:hypothetical protein
MLRDQPDDYARYAGLRSRLLIRGSAKETSPAADLCTNADNNGFMLAPRPVAPVNEADTVLLPDGLNELKRMARLTDLTIDGSYLNRFDQASSIVT